MKRPFKVIPMLAFLALAASCDNNQSGTADSKIAADNPFISASSLDLGAPDFTKIKDSDFKPALMEGMHQQLAEVDSIANNPEPATFENTLVALEKSGQMLSRVQGVFYLLTGANTNDELQKVEEFIAPKLAAHQDAIYLNDKLFQRVKAIHEQRDQLELDAESKRLIDFYYDEFVKAGANLSEADKKKLKKINEQLASLTTKFSNQLLGAVKDGGFTIENKEQLAGLSESEVAAAAQKAEESGQKGKWLFPLQNTTQQTALTNLSDRATRKSLFENAWIRNEKGDKNDTRSTLTEIASLRAQKGTLLGFDNYAAWSLQLSMANTPEKVMNFMAQLAPAATTKAKEEQKELQDLAHKLGEDNPIEAYDWNYFAEKLRKEKYDLNEEDIKPYFEINKVLEDGVFYAANQLYGISFKERKDLPVWNKDVRAFEVLDEDNSLIGLFYCDFFKRDNKSGGAWMSNILEQSKLLNQKPIIYNVCNFPKPAEGEPALLSYDNVETMFHEFGHALHGLFADQTYPSLSGTNVARDFVEFPSQFNEHWALNNKVLANYAKHYETGTVMPQALVEKIKKAATFNQGYMLTELTAAASLDMQWHTLDVNTKVDNVDTFEKKALQDLGLYLTAVPTRYRSSYFSHIFAGGYGAGYYAYLWTEMLEADAYQWFLEHGGMTRANGQRFRDMVLSKGNTIELSKVYHDFAGRDPNIAPMLKARGLN